MKRRVAAAAAVTLVALLSGCSTGSGHHDQAAPSTTPAATTSAAAKTTTSAPPKPADSATYRQTDTVLGVPGYFFKTPSGKFQCGILDQPTHISLDGPVAAGCQGTAAAIPSGEKDCVSSGNTQPPMPAFGVGPSGAQFACTADAVFYGHADAPALPYGSKLTVGNYSCLSQEAGITCTLDTTGAYFFVSAQSSRVVNSSDGNQGSGKIVVPDVRGERPAKATQLLTDAGLTGKTVGGADRGPAGGQCVVVSQQPEAGSKADKGAEITMQTGEAGGGTC